MVWDEKIGILLDFVGYFEDWGEVGFFSWCVDKSAIGSAAFPVHAISFCHPPYHKPTVFLHFSVGLIIEQTFDKIRSGLFEQNKLEHMFVLYLIYPVIVFILHFYIKINHF